MHPKSKQEAVKENVFVISATVSCSMEVFKQRSDKKGKYIIATNHLKENTLPHTEVINKIN